MAKHPSARTPLRAAFTAVFSALVVALLPGAAGAQRVQQQAPYTFHANVGEVLLHATVLDSKNRSIEDLPQSDFSLFENGVPQHIEYFAKEDAPVSVGILVDNSGSMSDKRPEVNQAALNFVKASNPGDEVFVVNFNDEYYLDAEFTSSIAKLQQGLQQIESRGGTALYDAVIASLDYLNQNAKNDKHVLLVVTDGDDNASRYTLEQAIRLVQAENPPLIYTIGLEDPDDTRSMKKSAERTLKALSQTTGGEAFFPKSLNQVDAITRQVAQDIRTQYTFSYHSNQTGDGYRTIRLEVNDPKLKHLTVRTRPGYYHGPAAAANAGH
ncbi:MAG TPA: VWA domain-containing protein [Terriglobales bacterium]|nr:VWA domain-containing protein [Terriglobales bacterium]